MPSVKQHFRSFLSATLDYALGIIGYVVVRTFGTRTMVVLAYHSVSESDWVSAVRPETFAQQVAWMKRYTQPISLADVEYGCREGIARSSHARVAITFDDGYMDWIEHARPILRSRTVPATFFITTEFGKLRTSIPYTHLQPIDENGVKQLASDGFEIGSHSHTHIDHALADDELIDRELRTSKQVLEQLLGIPITRFSFPKSRCRPNVKALLQNNGYTCACVGNGCVQSTTSPFALPRLSVRGVHTQGRFKARIYRALVFLSYASH